MWRWNLCCGHFQNYCGLMLTRQKIYLYLLEGRLGCWQGLGHMCHGIQNHQQCASCEVKLKQNTNCQTRVQSQPLKCCQKLGWTGSTWKRGVKGRERETSRSIIMSIRTVIPRGINRIAFCNLKYWKKQSYMGFKCSHVIPTGQEGTYWAPFQRVCKQSY
jgi:hypothetical protein